MHPVYIGIQSKYTADQKTTIEEEEVERTTNQIINNNLMTWDANYKLNIDVYTIRVGFATLWM